MPAVPVYWLLGDENAEGANAAALLSPSYPDYIGAQAGYKIWRHLSGAWQTYSAGTNSAPESVTDITRCGPEVSMLELMQEAHPAAANIYLFKHAIKDSTLGPQTGAANEWSPAAAEIYATILDRWDAALAALPMGETPDIQAIFWVQAYQDCTVERAASYEAGLRTLIARLRVDLGLPELKFVLAQWHNHAPVSQPDKLNHLEVRHAAARVAFDTDFVSVCNTDALALKAGSLLWSVVGSIDLGILLMGGVAAEALLPDSIVSSALPLYILIGGKNAYGQAATADLPDYLTGSLTDIYIWNPTSGAFELCLAGTNNNPTGANLFGPELSIGHELRRKHEGPVYIVKHTPEAGLLPPFGNGAVWHPPTGGHYSDLIQHVAAAIASIQSPDTIAVKAVFWVHGEEESGHADEEPSEYYEDYLRLLVSHLRTSLVASGSAEDSLPFVLAQLSDKDTGTHKSEVRAAQQALFANDPLVAMYDTGLLTYLASTNHFDAPSQIRLGNMLVKAFEEGLNSEILPMFVPSMIDMRKRLRLSGVPKGQDAMSMIADAVITVRAQFHRRMLQGRIEVLQALPRTLNPKTSNEHLRLIAEVTEVKMTRLELMRTMPVLFQDSSGRSQQSWNEEAPFRHAGRHELENEVLRLEKEIEEAMQILEGHESMGAETTMQVFDGSPTVAPPLPGDTLFHYSDLP